MKNKIITALSIFCLIGTVLLLNLIVQEKISARIDLTEGQIYTLGSGSKSILKALDTPVQITFYYSKDNNNVPGKIKNYARLVNDLLTEFDKSSAMVKVLRQNPTQDSEAEAQANFDGLKSMALQGLDKFYFGLTISCLDKSVNFSRLDPNQESLLEYQIIQAISQVHKGVKPTVGVLSPLPVLGSEFTVEMAEKNQRPSPPWIAFAELEKNFNLEKIPTQAVSLPEGLESLIVIHPTTLNTDMLKSIDRYLVQGGKLIVFLDPYSYLAAGLINRAGGKKLNLENSSDFKPFLTKWGIDYDSQKAVADLTLGRRVKKGEREVPVITLLDLRNSEMNQASVITNQIKILTMVFSGSFTSDKLASGLSVVDLIKTTKQSSIVDSDQVTKQRELVANFKNSEQNQTLGLELAGLFPAAYPENNGLVQKEGHVILLGDSDLLYDKTCVNTKDVSGEKVTYRLNNNIDFLQNSVEYLSGDRALIGVRGRQNIVRKFTKFQNMQAKADEKFKDFLISQKEEFNTLKATYKKLRDSQNDAKIIMTPQELQQMKQLKQTEAVLVRKIREATKDLRQDVEAEKGRIKFYGVALIPLLVALFGFIIIIIRNRRSRAR